jgi:hypothetical protein
MWLFWLLRQAVGTAILAAEHAATQQDLLCALAAKVKAASACLARVQTQHCQADLALLTHAPVGRRIPTMPACACGHPILA